MLTFLNAVEIIRLPQDYYINLDWIGQFARVIIEGVGIIGLGIIVFTLVLKAITLPFDIYQRVKMRKQNLIMKQMKPELEKLQKQYANDKQMYNQKMLELQKKNGIGVLSACLPMIISLVILIVAFQGFRSYSQYANLKLFAEMSKEYNTAIFANSVDGVDYMIRDNDGTYSLVWTEIGEDNNEIVHTEIENFTWTKDATLQSMGVETGDITYTLTEKEEKVSGDSYETRYYIVVSAADKYIQYFYNPYNTRAERNYEIDNVQKLFDLDEHAEEAVNAILEAAPKHENPEEDMTQEGACAVYVRNIGAEEAAKHYRANKPDFLWVRNVWYADVSYYHPVPSYSTFSSTLNVKVTYMYKFDENGKHKKEALSTAVQEPEYNNLTSALTTEQSQPNGYFILIILSIGLMVVSQLVTMKSSKESNQYQTVDGQGAKTQKMMLVIMPLIYAVFAFMYSAAFSIYMIMSSFFAICVTLLSNLILGRVFHKKEEEAFKEEHTQIPPWMKNRQNDKKGKRK